MANYLIEDSLIGPVYGNILLEFSVALNLDSEWFCYTESNDLMIIRIH